MQRDPLVVWVRSEGDAAIHASAVVTLIVEDDAGLSMVVLPKEADGREATFYVTYHNRTRAPIGVMLTAHNDEGGLRFSAMHNSYVVVLPCSSNSIMVRVAPIRPLRERRRYQIVFRGLLLEGENQRRPFPIQQACFTSVPSIAAFALPERLRHISTRALVFVLILLVVLIVVVSMSWEWLVMAPVTICHIAVG